MYLWVWGCVFLCAFLFVLLIAVACLYRKIKEETRAAMAEFEVIKAWHKGGAGRHT